MTRSLLILSAGLAVVLPHTIALSCKGDEPVPDPVALLRGVEQARSAVLSGRFEYRFQLAGSPNASAENARITFAFDRDQRKLTEERRILVISPPDIESKNQRLVSLGYDRDEFVRLGLGSWETTRQVTIIRGNEVLATADPSTGAAIGDQELLRGRSFSQSIDPRQLGIGVHGRLDAGLERFLAAKIATNITCLGSESVNGNRAWHVRLTLPGDRKAESHLWISDTTGFPVYRMRITVNGQITSQVDSEYRQPMDRAVFPRLVRVRTEINSQDVARIEFTVEETLGEYGAVIPQSEFTLAGLNLSRGAPVGDSRTKQMLGYWDGTELTQNIKAAIKGPPLTTEPNMTWPWYWWTIPAALVLLGFGGWLWQRRRSQPA